VIVNSPVNLAKKRPNREQIATSGFLMVFGTLEYGQSHTKSPKKSHCRKAVKSVAMGTIPSFSFIFTKMMFSTFFPSIVPFDLRPI